MLKIIEGVGPSIKWGRLPQQRDWTPCPACALHASATFLQTASPRLSLQTSPCLLYAPLNPRF